MKARADLQQRVDVALDLERSGGRLNHLGHQLEQGAFARAVAADDRDLFAAANLQIDAVERGVLRIRAVPSPSSPNMSRKR